MPLPLIAATVAGAIGMVTSDLAIDGQGRGPTAVIEVQAGDRNRIGRSYVEPRTVPGIESGPLLTTPGYQPRTAPRAGARSGSGSATGMPPTASDCAAGYSARSRWTRREFNRLCGQGS